MVEQGAAALDPGAVAGPAVGGRVGDEPDRQSEWYVVALDFKTRRATIGSVATGVTAIGGTLAIAECR